MDPMGYIYIYVCVCSYLKVCFITVFPISRYVFDAAAIESALEQYRAAEFGFGCGFLPIL